MTVINYKFTGQIPVIFHNLRGYDSHLIMQGLSRVQNKEVNCISNNMKKYISFSIGKLDFIDSLQFMNSSLGLLVGNLAKEGPTMFYHLQTKSFFSSVKGSIRMIAWTVNPNLNKQAYLLKNQLRDENSDEDYLHAQLVFSTFNLRNLGEYHHLYLKSDVLLLADVFENVRSIYLNYNELDPCHSYTSPGLAWQARLKMSNVELELLPDPDMYLFVEKGLRGGISMVSNRYSKANNPYISEYNREDERKCVTYLDANSLYGWAMSQALPIGW